MALLSLTPSSLAIRTSSGWWTWWDARKAPVEWSGPLAPFVRSFDWHQAANSVEWGEARMAIEGAGHRVRLIAVCFDPLLVRVRLDTAYRRDGGRPDWSIARAPESALLAMNAGQFRLDRPWGWAVLGGREYREPARGPLAVAVVFDSSGGVRWIPDDSLDGPKVRRGVESAFQSFPRLLANGVVPLALRGADHGIDLRHRDARAAIGETADGKILLLLTRYDGFGPSLGFVPIGLTVPELAAVMGALGAREAVALDGGISSQLLIRDATVHAWNGVRRVPMGLIVTARP
jgi:exopolysaccharide biosynthesis protein